MNTVITTTCAKIDSTSRHETEVRVEVHINHKDGAGGPVVAFYITFGRGDNFARLPHRDRATAYAADVSGVRCFAALVSTLAGAERRHYPRRGVGLQALSDVSDAVFDLEGDGVGP